MSWYPYLYPYLLLHSCFLQHLKVVETCSCSVVAMLGQISTPPHRMELINPSAPIHGINSLSVGQK